MELKRKQHVLPESYLKRWADPATTVPGKTAMVWTISKDGKHKRLKPPASNHFWRDCFYDLTTRCGQHRQDLENLLGSIESSFARIVENLIIPSKPVSHIELQELDLFVAGMSMRTEKMRESISSFASAKARIEKDHAISRSAPPPDTSGNEHNAHALAICEGICFISGRLAAMSHNVFVAPAGKAYVTSDTPCTWRAPTGCVGLANPALEITLPLTPNHLLHVSKVFPLSGSREAEDFWVDLMNWDTIRGARRYFIANSSVVDPDWFENEAVWTERLLQTG